MLLKVNEDLHLEASPAEVWALLRDTRASGGAAAGGGKRERGSRARRAKPMPRRASEKIGPFKITMNLEVRVTEVQDGSVLKAAIKGGDSVGLNRVTGSLQIGLAPAAAGTEMRFEASIEVLGKTGDAGRGSHPAADDADRLPSLREISRGNLRRSLREDRVRTERQGGGASKSSRAKRWRKCCGRAAGLTGVKLSCEAQVCGSLHGAGGWASGERVHLSGLRSARQARDRRSKAWRIESGQLHPLQQAFLDQFRVSVRVLHAGNDSGGESAAG